jgi:MmyB-like transcription regulator ligand binding domain
MIESGVCDPSRRAIGGSATRSELAVTLDVLTAGVATALLTPPMNALRVSLPPKGMAPRIVNFVEWSTHLLGCLDRQIAVSGDFDLVALAEELWAYPGVGSERAACDLASRLFVPLMIQHRGQELRFFRTIATFGAALDITVAELSIESFFPADRATTDAVVSPSVLR